MVTHYPLLQENAKLRHKGALSTPFAQNSCLFIQSIPAENKVVVNFVETVTLSDHEFWLLTFVSYLSLLSGGTAGESEVASMYKH